MNDDVRPVTAEKIDFTAPVLVGELVPAGAPSLKPPGRPDGRFVKGDPRLQPGRRKGAKNALSGDFIKDLAKWYRKNGYKAIEKVGREKPEKLIEILAGLIPKHDILETVHHDGISLAAVGLQEVERRTQELLDRIENLADPPASSD